MDNVRHKQYKTIDNKVPHECARSRDKSDSSQCHCFSVRQAARIITHIYEKHLGKAHITTAQFSILNYLKTHPRPTRAELAQEMSLERTSLLRALKPLERYGYIKDIPATESKKLTLALTDVGMKKLEQAVHYWKSAQNEWIHKIGKDQADSLSKQLANINRN